ncbi:MAG: hypothetical protein IJ837_00320 [Clostridia bacterium]|nr:hypothetical protein [Clostridia bacterium]
MDNLPNYIKTSTYKNSAKEDGKEKSSHKWVKEWHYFENNVEINKKNYNIFIDVKDTGRNQFVYFVRFHKE